MGSDALRDDRYVVNHAVRAEHRDPWWWPVVDTHYDGVDQVASAAWNDVTFCRRDEPGDEGSAVELVGSFTALHERVALRRVLDGGSPTPWRAVTVRVPRARVFRYLFLLAGTVRVLDPVNPQRTTTDDGREWSRFFTDACTVPLELDRGERDLLSRLVTRLLPFRVRDAEILLDAISPDPRSAARSFPRAHLLDEDVGVVNGIDKLLARSERHRAGDYHLALGFVADHLRGRFPGQDPAQLPVAVHDDVLAGLLAGRLAGWPEDPQTRPRPEQFGRLLRRHAVTAAFAHPRHGGNVAARGWEYLESRYTDPSGGTLFDWRRAVEAPLGSSTRYRG